MAYERTEKIKVPVTSDPEQMEWLHVTLNWDSPNEYEADDYTVYYYEVTLVSTGEKRTIAAYGGLHKTIQAENPLKGTTLRIARFGEGKETRWYVKYISGPQGTADTQDGDPITSEQPNRTVRQEVSSPMANKYIPLDEDERQVLLAIALDRVDLWESLYKRVQEYYDTGGTEMDPELVSRITTGALITAERTYKRGMVMAEKELTPLETFKMLTSDVPDDQVAALAIGIMAQQTGYSENEVKRILMSYEGVGSVEMAEKGTEFREHLFELVFTHYADVELANQDDYETREMLGARHGLVLKTDDDIPF